MDLQSSVTADQAAVSAFVTAARALPEAAWAVPVAPGKWSPGQYAEHLVLTYEYCLGTLQGKAPGKRPPRFLRPVIRFLFLNPVLKAGAFTRKVKAPLMFEPSATPAAREAVLTRLQTAASAFDTAAAAAVKAGQTTVDHPFFGSLDLGPYVNLQAIHTRHHQAHLTAAK